jgi:hypothetical protein
LRLFQYGFAFRNGLSDSSLESLFGFDGELADGSLEIGEFHTRFPGDRARLPALALFKAGRTLQLS